MTAVNQSLGRVIRHINDYGVMVCIDERFKFYEKYLSIWIREHYEKYKNNIDSNIKDFFNEQREKFQHIKSNNRIKPNNINSNQSGFNSTIIFENNDLFDNINNKKEKENLEKFKNDNNIIFSEEIEIISSDEDIDNNNMFEILNKKSTKNNQFLVHIFEFDISNMNQKNNNNEELNIIDDNNKENSKKINIVDKKINENEQINLFNKYEKEGLDLLESLNEFIINNPKNFDKILNKYK